MAAVLVDARTRLSYGFFYLQAAPGPLRFTRKGFEDLEHIDPFRTLLPMIVDGRRIVIDLGDSPEVREDVLNWSDVYGKVNATAAHVAAGVTPLGPGFGTRGGYAQCLRHALTTPLPREGLKAGIADRRNLLRRSAPLSSFVPGQVEPDYLFSVNSLWEWPDTQQSTNQWRARWMRLAQSNPTIRFEGGFVARPNSELGPPTGPQEQEFADLLMRRRISASQWISNTQRSFAVFNTPAVHSCHGWKLGQYLAMGKAIISTPLTRELPSPLVPGEHIHEVTRPEELESAMALLRTDERYRRRLEANAHQYWTEHLRPDVVWTRLLRA